MTDESRKRLRELAEAASPGPWRECASEVLIGDHWWRPANYAHYYNEHNAAFIAAANPTAVVELLDDLATITAERDALREEKERRPLSVIAAYAETEGLRQQLAAANAEIERLRGRRIKSDPAHHTSIAQGVVAGCRFCIAADDAERSGHDEALHALYAEDMGEAK